MFLRMILQGVRCKSLACGLAAVCWAGVMALQAQAVTTVWGTQFDTGQIIMIDPTNGNILGGFAAPTSLGGDLVNGLTIAEGGNSLLFINDDPDQSLLYRLNPQTGEVLSTHALPINERGGLSYQTVDGGPDSIFALQGGGPVQQQLGFDGAVVPFVSVSPEFPGAMGGDDQGRHFVWADGLIQEFDSTTGVVVNSFAVNPTGIEIDLGGLAFDGQFLYASNSASKLLTLDPNTGAILNSVDVLGGPFTGLAAAPMGSGNGGSGGSGVPEPVTAALGLMGLGVLGMATWRRVA